ncbi:protease HtpX [Biformimicrobium ophioploci]|uniref:Protease HtpX n=1 Tax=Biformimicrobium ophioploci TaxID=3036711 RepID=A0ABQ6LWK5_9GAMM|nr:protease HtpX [Microbulbifer sp. NKW57]GMG86435.1 protease HtpX [Microbulbifer sp. NKW57]
MLRIGLFLLTNIAVLVLAGIVMNLLGLNGILASNGVDLDVGGLLAFCAVFGFIGSFVSLFLSKFMAKRAMGVHMIEQPQTADERWLLDTVKELADKAGIGMPEVGIFPAPESNAFATGWNRNESLVAVSEGLLHRFSREEVRAVLGHEIGHVANGDMITLSLIQGVVNTFVMFFARLVGFFVDRVILKNEEGLGIGYYITSIVMDIVFGFIAMFIVAWFSRRREFRADEAGANLAGTNAMIGALARLKAESEAGAEVHMPSSMRAFGISGNSMAMMLSSHPPLADRILALQNRAA